MPQDKFSCWSENLAISLVCSRPLVSSTFEALRSIFLSADVLELRIVLAQGTSNEFEIYPIISNRAINTDNLTSTGSLPPSQPLIATAAMEKAALYSISTSSTIISAPEDNEYLDWVDLKARGCSWAIAAPLACTPPRCSRMLGAVIVGGKGECKLDSDWFKEWGCELARGIAHASVSIMESSLDFLRRIFPPPRVEALVYKAASPSNSEEVPEELAKLIAEANAGVSTTAAATVPLISTPSLIVRRDADFVSHKEEDATLAETSKELRQPGMASPLAAPVPSSPFAAFSTQQLASQPASFASSRRPISTDSERKMQDEALRSLSLPLSVASSINNAAAVLHQASLHSHNSGFFNDDVAVASPANSEFEGYEDLLTEDMQIHALRKPSQQLERAHSRESKEASPLEGSSGSSSGAASSSFKEEHINESKAQKMRSRKLVANTSRDRDSRIDSDEMMEQREKEEENEKAEERHYHNFHHSQHLRHSEQATGSFSRLSTISESTSQPNNQQSASRSLSSQLQSLLLSSGGADSSRLNSFDHSYSLLYTQNWDLSFSNPESEEKFSKNFLARKLAASEVVIAGLIMLVEFSVVLYYAVNAHLHVHRPLHSAFLLFFVFLQSASVFIFPTIWNKFRAYVVPILRICAAMLIKTQLLNSTLVTVDSLLAPAVLGAISVIFPLPFKAHVPLQLFCLWVSAISSVLNGFLIGFIAPSMVIYLVEIRRRRKFVLESQYAQLSILAKANEDHQKQE